MSYAKRNGAVFDAFNDSIENSVFNVSATASGGARAESNGVNMGGITIQVYGSPGQDEEVLAQKIAQVLNRQVINARAVFA